MRVNTIDPSWAGRPKARVKNPTFPGNVYLYRQGIYDKYQVAVNTALDQQILFSTAVGASYTPTGGVQVKKNLFMTNLTGQGGILPSPRRLMVKYISLHLREDALVTDAIRFLNDSLIIFSLNEREYWRSRGVKVPAAGGVYGFSSAIVSNGFPQVDNQLGLWSPPVDLGLGAIVEGYELIQQGQNFGVTVDPTLAQYAAGAGIYTTATTANGGFGINAEVMLDGILTREIQ